jgi:hypothetical protein
MPFNITGLGPPRLNKTEVCAVSVGMTLALISAVAFVALQYIQVPYKGGHILLSRMNNSLYSVLAGSTFLVTSTVALSILVARSLRFKENKQKFSGTEEPIDNEEVPAAAEVEQPEVLVDKPAIETNGKISMGIQTASITGLDPLKKTRASAETLKVKSLAETQAALKAHVKEEVATFLAAVDSIAKTKVEVDQQQLNAQRGQLESKILAEVSLEGFKANAVRGFTQELVHFAYVFKASEGWKKKKNFKNLDGKNELKEDLELKNAVSYFNSLKEEKLKELIKEAKEKAAELQYAYISSLVDLLDLSKIQDKASLEAALKGICAEAFREDERYAKFARGAKNQVKNMLGLPVYLSGYMVMWQEWFIKTPVVKIPFIGKKALPNLLSWAAAKEGIKHNIVQNCSVQLLSRAPMFLRQKVDFENGEGQLITEGVQFCLSEIMQAVSRPILYTSKPGNQKAPEKLGAHIAKFFQDRKETYQPLVDTPFAVIPKFDSQKAVKELTTHIEKFTS